MDDERIFADNLEGIEFISVTSGRASVPANTPHQIVRDKKTGKDVGIAIFNGNREGFKFRIYKQDIHYLFYQGGAFQTYPLPTFE